MNEEPMLKIIVDLIRNTEDSSVEFNCILITIDGFIRLINIDCTGDHIRVPKIQRHTNLHVSEDGIGTECLKHDYYTFKLSYIHPEINIMVFKEI